MATRLGGRGVTVRAMRHMAVAGAASLGVPGKGVTGRAMNLPVQVRMSTSVAGVTANAAQDREERRRQAPSEGEGDEHCVHVR
jgi:hypothetical protein